MQISHDKENFELMVKDMKDVRDTIESFTAKIESINERLFKMDILGVSNIVENAIEDLEQKLLYDYKDNFEEFIENLEQGNEVMLKMDDEKVFRNNREIMNKLDDGLKEIVFTKLITNIENLEEIKTKLNGLEILDDIQAIAQIIIGDSRYGGTPNAFTNVNTIGMETVKVFTDYKIVSVKENFKFMNYEEQRNRIKVTLEFDGREYTFIINGDRISLPFGVFVNYKGNNIFVNYKNYESMDKEIRTIIDNEYGGLEGLTEMARYYEDEDDGIADAISGQTDVAGLVNEFEAHADMLYQKGDVTTLYNIFTPGYRTEDDIEHSLGIADVGSSDDGWDANLMGHWPL